MSMIGPSAWRTLHSDRGILENKIERRTLRRVVTFARPHRKLISLFLVGTVVDAGLVVVPPLLMQRLVDDGILAARRLRRRLAGGRHRPGRASPTPCSGSSPATSPAGSARA